MLPKPTERLLRALDALPAARGLVIAGGTALALRLGHRSSADLDFVFATARLPRRRVSNLVSVLGRKHRVARLPDVSAEHDFLTAGLELPDYQQDYSVDGVKVSFFVPDPRELRAKVKSGRGVAGLRNIRVADLDSLFLMKAVTLNRRLTTRDLFDLYWLIEKRGYAAAELFRAANVFGFDADVLKTRLLHARPARDDPGIETPVGAAPTFDQLKAYFAAAIDRLEQAEAEEFFAKKRR